MKYIRHIMKNNRLILNIMERKLTVKEEENDRQI